MYVAVKGGEKAIDAAHALQESRRRGDTDLPELSVAQIEQQLNLAVDRVMTEGGIADRELAALASIAFSPLSKLIRNPYCPAGR